MPLRLAHAEKPTSSESSKKRPWSPDQDEMPESALDDFTTDLTLREEQTIPAKPTLTFWVGDASKLEQFYKQTFVLLQQATMKVMLKTWIKFIEPDKQKKWPYCLSIERRLKNGVRHRGGLDGRVQPPWWPNTIKHIEPDHLGKEGCHKLALVIIKCVQKSPGCRGRGIQLLRRETCKLNFRFHHEPEEKYKRRLCHLHQLFDIASKQEDFMNGCISTYHLSLVGEEYLLML
jgi:hypothetical protein